MPQDKNDLHPEKWNTSKKELTSTALADNEEIRMAMALEVLSSAKNTGRTLNIFAVVETPTHISARVLLRHDENGIPVKYTGFEFATYPKKDLNALVSEVRQKVLGFAEYIMSYNPNGLRIDTNTPVAYIQALGDGVNTREFLNRELETKINQKADEVALSILDVLKIKEKPFQIAPVMPQDEKLTNLAKAAQEMALIKKFGKKKITELAQKMNYKGEIINK